MRRYWKKACDVYYLNLSNYLPGSFGRSRYGVWLQKNPQDLTYRFCISGAYGDYLATVLREGSYEAFFDIGANQGLYSLIAARNPRIGQVYAFEPNPEVFKFLSANIERNRSRNIDSFPVGLGDTAATMILTVVKNHSGAGTLRNALGAPSHPDRLESFRNVAVRIETSTFLNENIAEIKKPGQVFCKIDTEGYEPLVLQALRNSHHWPRVSDIFLEADEDFYDVRNVLETLEHDGFGEVFRNGSVRARHYDVHLHRDL
jgi:FkbM family methyltransferase